MVPVTGWSGVTHPDSATLSVSAILRAMVSVLETCAALLAARATLFPGAAGTALALLALLVVPASVGVMSLAWTVVLCLLANACHPAGGLLGVTCAPGAALMPGPELAPGLAQGLPNRIKHSPLHHGCKRTYVRAVRAGN